MPESIHCHPFTPAGRENYDRIFRKSDPAHSLVPGTVREYRSECCGKTLTYEAAYAVCDGCGKPCTSILTKVNP